MNMARSHSITLHERRESARMSAESVQQKFTAALDALVEQVKQDRSILAAILCGSLSHDTVWAKSDIDLVLVTIDDKKVEPVRPGALRGRRQRPRVPDAARGVPQDGRRLGPQLVHALAPGQGAAALHARRDDRRPLRRGCSEIGERDTQVQLLRAATDALPPIDKAHKWFVTRGDLDYTALWILYAATPLAQIEVIGARLLADREVIPQAMKLNPAFFKIDLHRPAQREEDARRASRRRSTPSTTTWRSARRRCSRRCIDHLREVGEARSCTEIEDHFKRQLRRRAA